MALMRLSRRSRASCRLIACQFAQLLTVALPARVSAQSSVAVQQQSCAAHADEAARRSGLSSDIVLRVMRAESAGYPRAVSVRGAMGCMQIMPATWRELTARYAIGADPFDPRMNMIAGALYLAELKRRFGFPAAYAAYNAGPGRLDNHLATGAPLPVETIRYAQRLGGERPFTERPPARPRWQESALFAARENAASTSHANAARLASEQPNGEALFALSPRRSGQAKNER